MEKTGYERYGLRGNPFRDLASETLDNVEFYHVNQSIDDELKVMREEVFEKENKAVVAVLGTNGVGKTHRLLLVANEAKRNNVFYVLKNVDEKASWAVKGIVDAILESAKDKGLVGFLSQPGWYKNLLKMSKNLRGYSPEVVGKAIANALSATAPSCLLLNDFSRMSKGKSLDRFVRVLRVVSDSITPGVLIMISSDVNYFDSLMNNHPSMDSRINREVVIPKLDDNEASLVIAKRLLEKRLVDDIDALYPFTEDSVKVLNSHADGNPRELLSLSSVVVDFAANNRAMTINEELTLEALKMGRNQKLNVDYDSKKPRRSISKTSKVREEKPDKKNFNKVELKKNREVPQKSISDNAVNVNSSSCGCSVPVENQDIDESSDQKEIVENKTEDAQSFDRQSKTSNMDVESAKVVRVKCPKCSRIFSFECEEEKSRMQCPNPDCDFIGVVNISKLQK